ncbi:MAG: hypothetical protein LBI19_05905 [Oscillospiraceae bacterium]|jgi:hypothetical protein|nr:hypothetical protein [Oscillospiraceae bacterium]
MSSKLDPKQKAQRTNAAKVITGMGASTAFFVITLFYTMGVFFNALSSGASYFGLYSGFMGRPAGITDLTGDAILLQAGLWLLALIPSILICAGLWTLCFRAREPNGSLNGPLFLIKGAVIAQFCLIFLLILVMQGALIASLSFINIERFALSGRLAAGLSQAVIGGVILLIAGMAAALVFYFINILKTVNMAISTLQTGQRWGDVPTPLIVMNYLFAAVNFISAGFEISRGNAASAVSAICTAAFLAGLSASLSAVRRGL